MDTTTRPCETFSEAVHLKKTLCAPLVHYGNHHSLVSSHGFLGKVTSGSSCEPHVPRNKTQTQSTYTSTLAIKLGSYMPRKKHHMTDTCKENKMAPVVTESIGLIAAFPLFLFTASFSGLPAPNSLY